MSAKKPWFKARTDWTENLSFYGEEGHRVRVTDARELTAEKAVERVLQGLRDGDGWTINGLRWAAKQVDMTATVKNGKVKVRRAT